LRLLDERLIRYQYQNYYFLKGACLGERERLQLMMKKWWIFLYNREKKG